MLRKHKYQKTILPGIFKNRNAQVSVEYLFILGLTLAIIVPGSILFYNYSKSSNEELVASQVNRIGKNIVTSAEEIYTIGKNSWVTLEIDFPENTINAYTLADSELIIEYITSRGVVEAVFFSDVNIKGLYGDTNISQNFHSGRMNIRIDSKGGYVSIGERNY